MKTNKLKLTSYGNVDCRDGVPRGYVVTNINRRILNKHDIKIYEALLSIDCVYGSTYKPVIGKLISKSDEKRVLKLMTKQKTKVGKSLTELLTSKKIAEAIYSINKEAKKYRDRQTKYANELFGRRDRFDYEY